MGRKITPEQYLEKCKRKSIAQALFDGKSKEEIVEMGYTAFSVQEVAQDIATKVDGNIIICSACDQNAPQCIPKTGLALGSDATSDTPTLSADESGVDTIPSDPLDPPTNTEENTVQTGTDAPVTPDEQPNA